MSVAILPARGGSKRIPRKNIRDFLGRPAIAWPIAAALQVFDRVVVSTDDDEIAAVARAAGADVPFARDADLADDHTGTTEVIADAVKRLGLEPDSPVACIYPTAMLIQPDDLRDGLKKLQAATWVLSLGEYRTPIQRAYQKTDTGFAALDPVSMPKRSQDLDPAYFDAGQFYLACAATWTTPGARVWDGAAGVILPETRAVDVDTPEDWARAERMAQL
jgi:N-acylneuraminate cytidylyltransferase